MISNTDGMTKVDAKRTQEHMYSVRVAFKTHFLLTLLMHYLYPIAPDHTVSSNYV